MRIPIQTSAGVFVSAKEATFTGSVHSLDSTNKSLQYIHLALFVQSLFFALFSYALFPVLLELMANQLHRKLTKTEFLSTRYNLVQPLDRV